MAISRMQKLSLILDKGQLDAVLLSLQGLSRVQIYDLKESQDWQEAFEREQVFQPAGETQELLQRQADLEHLIQQLEPYMPQKKLLESLREKPLETSFASLEQAGQVRDEEALREQVHKQLQVLASAREQIARAEIQVADLEKWAPLDITPKQLERFSHIHGVIGSLPNQDTDSLRMTLKAHPDLDVEEVFTSETEHGLVIFYKSGSLQEVQDLLAGFDFKPFDYDLEELPAQRLEDLQGQIREQTAVVESCLDSLTASKADLDQLKMQVDYLLNRAARQSSKLSLASTDYLVALEGWIEADQVPDLQAHLTDEFGASLLLQVTDVTEEEWDQVPTQLRNAGLIEPFELVTEMYALPKYGDKDPTPFVSLLYFVFFGMMVADIGYGLVLFAGTSLALKLFHVKPGLAKNLRFFRLLGVSVMLWGCIYGSFLGFELPFALISTSRDIMTILAISVIFGFITIMAGLWFSGRKNWRLKDYGEAYNSGFAWVLILLGLALLVVGKLVPNLALLAVAGQWLAILNAVGILIVSVLTSRKVTGLISGLFNLYNVSGYVGDLVSFTRLMALGLAGASMGSAFNLIVSLFPPVARFSLGILVFLILHLVNMSLSFLSGYVHSARLIFVEFFGKFYEGGGSAFRPLKPVERYVKNKK